MNTLNKLHVLTYCTPLEFPELAGLCRSAKRFGFDLRLLTTKHSKNWREPKPDKMKSVQAYIEENSVPDDHVILFVDGLDVVFGRGSAEELLDTFHAMNCPVLFSAESNCYPNKFEQQYPGSASWTTESDYKYLNAGLYIAYAGDLLPVLRKANELNLDTETFHRYFNIQPNTDYKELGYQSPNEYFKDHYPPGRCDQLTFKYLYLNGVEKVDNSRSFPIRLDTKCRIFQNINNDTAKDLVFDEGWFNANQNTRPFIFHSPGNTGNLPPVCAKLGLHYRIFHNKDLFEPGFSWRPEYKHLTAMNEPQHETLFLSNVQDFGESLTPSPENYFLLSRAGEERPVAIKQQVKPPHPVWQVLVPVREPKVSILNGQQGFQLARPGKRVNCNDVAIIIWKMCNSKRSIEHITQRLSKRISSMSETSISDVYECLAALASAGFLRLELPTPESREVKQQEFSDLRALADAMLKDQSLPPYYLLYRDELVCIRILNCRATDFEKVNASISRLSHFTGPSEPGLLTIMAHDPEVGTQSGHTLYKYMKRVGCFACNRKDLGEHRFLVPQLPEHADFAGKLLKADFMTWEQREPGIEKLNHQQPLEQINTCKRRYVYVRNLSDLKPEVLLSLLVSNVTVLTEEPETVNWYTAQLKPSVHYRMKTANDNMNSVTSSTGPIELDDAKLAENARQWTLNLLSTPVDQRLYESLQDSFESFNPSGWPGNDKNPR